MRNSETGSQNVAALSTLIASDASRLQAFGVTMAGTGRLDVGEDGYPFIYLTVKDGGRRMFDRWANSFNWEP